jgi:hypothetical protein
VPGPALIARVKGQNDRSQDDLNNSGGTSGNSNVIKARKKIRGSEKVSQCSKRMSEMNKRWQSRNK